MTLLQSLLRPHLLPPPESNPPILANTFPTVATVVGCVILLFFTLSFVLHRKRMVMFCQALFVPRVSSQLLRECKLLGEWIYLYLLLAIFLTQALFFSVLVEQFCPRIAEQFSNISLFGIIFGAVAIDYFLKMLLMYFYTYLFDYQEERFEYYLNKLSYLTINSLALFPIVCCGLYTGFLPILFLYAGVFGITFLTLFYRLFILNIKKVGAFQFFLYFCTIEILPYLVLAKVVLSLGR